MESVVFRLRQFGGWLLGLLGIVAASLSAWDIVDHYIKDQTKLSIISNIYVLSVSFILLLYLCIRQYQTIRKEKYANISFHIHRAIHTIRDADTFLIEKKPEDDSDQSALIRHLDMTKQKFTQALDRVVDIFEILTATRCRACIKLVYELEGGLFVYTYARDQKSSDKCRKDDRWRAKTNHDALEKNPRFAELFSSDENQWYYFCNNLASDDKFKTTSATVYKPDHSYKVNHSSVRSILKGWPLPYKSTVTCVIRQGEFDLYEDRDSEVVGFLSIDSESRGVFEKRWDPEILFAVADALFTPLRSVIEVQELANAAAERESVSNSNQASHIKGNSIDVAQGGNNGKDEQPS